MEPRREARGGAKNAWANCSLTPGDRLAAIVSGENDEGRRKVKILMVGHSCSPYRGSEAGIGWNWAWHASEQNEVWFLTHAFFREEINRFLSGHSRPNLHVVFVPTKSFLDRLIFGDGVNAIRLHYVLWLKAAFEEARRLTSQQKFDIVHHVSWGTINVPSPFWKLGPPFIWGPVGGGQTTPPELKKCLGAGARALETIRGLNVSLLSIRPAFREAARNSSRVFAVNKETANVIRRAGKPNVDLFLDCGSKTQGACIPQRPLDAERPFTILWAGSIQPRKGLALAIEAMAKLEPTCSARLLVAGDGPMRSQSEILCHNLNISDKVQFLGSIPHQQVSELMATSDAFLFTSIRDTFGSVVLEAAAHALPIIALNHQGIAAFVPDGAAIKVPVADLESTIQGLAAAITKLQANPQFRRDIGSAAYQFARRNTWPERAKTMTRVYAQVVSERLATMSVSNSPKAPANPTLILTQREQ